MPDCACATGSGVCELHELQLDVELLSVDGGAKARRAKLLKPLKLPEAEIDEDRDRWLRLRTLQSETPTRNFWHDAGHHGYTSEEQPIFDTRQIDELVPIVDGLSAILSCRSARLTRLFPAAEVRQPVAAPEPQWFPDEGRRCPVKPTSCASGSQTVCASQEVAR